jgi:hypothetical protein
MINGVLVERTVKEVVPALKTNSEGLKKVLDELVVQYKSKQDEMEKWKVCIISIWDIKRALLPLSRRVKPPADINSYQLQKKNNIQVVQQ